MSKEKAMFPMRPNAKLGLCDRMDDFFVGAAPSLAAGDAGYESPQPCVNMRTSKLTTMIRSFKSSLKSTNRYTRFDATKTFSNSPISPPLREKLDTELPFLQFDPSGVPLDQDSNSCCSSRMEISFDNVIDTILHVSDDMANLSTDDACCAAESSPIRVIVNSPLPGASESQDPMVDSADSMVQSNQGSNNPTICDSQDNHTTLIRDMESASHSTTPSRSPTRRLDFYDESDVLQRKRVNIQDSRNTVRYFSRSAEEKAFYRRGRLFKKNKKKAIDPVVYAPPLPDIPLTETEAEGDVVASMRETVTGAGSMLREEVMTKMEQFRKWTGDKASNISFRGASQVLQDTMSGSQEKVKQSMLALAKLGTTADGDQRPPAQPVSLNESWEENSTRLKATALTFSEAIRCICVDATCVDHGSTHDVSDEAIELPLSEHQRVVEEFLERNSPQIYTRKSLTSTFEQNVYIATTISESTTDSSESGQSSLQYDRDLSRGTSVESPVRAGRGDTLGTGVFAKDLQRKQFESVGIARKLDVVSDTRRWKLAQRSPTPTPPKVSLFLEMDQLANDSLLQQPILDGDSSGDGPSTPPKCNRTAPMLMPTGAFSNLKRSPSAKLKKEWSAAKLKSSPVSALDI